MRRKIVISTIDMSFMLSNYGTFFQHVCLRRRLEERGFTCARWWFGKRTPSRFGWFVKLLENYARIVYWSFSKKARHRLFLKNCLPDYKLKTLFRKDYRLLVGEFNEDVSVAEDTVCLMGSDQVLSGNEKTWFGNVPTNIKRVIYAGSADWVACKKSQDWKNLVSREMPKFDGVSVRELEGVDICQKYAASGVRVVHTLDPVLLEKRSRFIGMATGRHVLEENTLLCYLVNIECKEGLHINDLETLANTLGCKLRIIGIQGAAGLVPRKYRMILSPCEFIRAYLDAKFIVTNSFHGTVFALVFHKPFLSVEQICKTGTDQNLRQRELLSWLGLEHFHVAFSKYRSDVWANLIKLKYDGEALDAKIEEKRNFSLSWLDQAVKA